MKSKHILAYMKICDINAELSECPRRKFGAVIIDPISNMIIAAGYNGYIRGGSRLCGGDVCLRETMKIESGTHMEIGCIHAEENVMINAARQGTSTVGMWLFVNGDPCTLCARRMVQAGIKKVFFKKVGYPSDGIKLLRDNGVEVEEMK